MSLFWQTLPALQIQALRFAIARGVQLRSIKKKVAFATVALLAAAVVSIANAQQPITRVETKLGGVVVQELIGAGCKPLVQCRAVSLNDRVLAKDSFASIPFVYPSLATPKLIGIYTSTGGNACCWQTSFLDVTVTPPLLVDDIGDGKLSDAPDGVQIVKTSGTNPLGDKLVTTYSYAWGSGRLVALKEAASTTSGLPGPADSPNDVLSNIKLREPLLKLIGPSYFAAFRRNLGVSAPVKIFDSRYIVGSGCTPHACCASAAIFALDVVANKAWALQLHNDNCRDGANRAEIWGTLSAADAVPRRELEAWLRQNKMNWYSVAIAAH